MLSPPAVSGRHDFAFQNGEWRVRHRKLRERLAGSDDWLEFGGTCRAWEVMGGLGHIEDNMLDDPSGAYRAAAFRLADSNTGQWSIWWADERYPGIDVPVRGRFEDGVGTFFADDTFEGRPVRLRFIWSEIEEDKARWEQALSDDDGRSWEVNWIMRFERVR
ncbi:DUF1579 domain-containing protein [Sphingosinicella terrae]|jgi:hypothetical protein|uniref:DUF1579 domain-containing protein n=1 Tax=Sphingosinicella terrae TaxID=2172047 RepID=UPI000E0D6456|nr:DUF1579 domain-containing protein [Sphingosinicella terrae]